MLVRAICILSLLIFNTVHMNMHSCVCTGFETSGNPQKIETKQKLAFIEDVSDSCSDCGHKKSCCAQKQAQDYGVSFIEVAFFDVPSIESCPAVAVAVTRVKREMVGNYLNKAPPQDLVSLHKKLLV